MIWLYAVGLLVYIFVGIGAQAMILEEDEDPFDNAWIVVVWPFVIAGFIVYGFAAGAYMLGKYIKNKFKKSGEKK